MKICPPKAIIVGAATTIVLTLVIQIAPRFYRPGETAMGWAFLLPWFATVTPAVLVARAVGINLAIGNAGMTLPLFLLMLAVNGLIEHSSAGFSGVCIVFSNLPPN
jgi:hypothetical protein